MYKRQSQSIPAESKVNKGTVIVFTVSKGVEQFELPNVIGMDYDEAKDKLHDSNFLVKREYVENDGTHTAQEVQGIHEMTIGEQYPKGTTVTLLVWDEPLTEEGSTENDPFSPQLPPVTSYDEPTQGTADPEPSAPAEPDTVPTEPATSPLVPQTTVPPATESPETLPPTEVPTTAGILDLLF